MKTKTVKIDELQAMMLNTPESIKAFEEADRELALSEQLYAIRERAKLNQKAIAEIMGMKASQVSRLERSPGSANLKTLERYAAACGATLSLSFPQAK